MKIGIIGLLLPCALFADCVNFPAGLVPLSAINYVSAADAAGDQLVVGTVAGGASGLNALTAQFPLPASTNQTFCDPQVQLAPQQFYPNVYVPTAAELSGNFAAFTGLLLNPATNQPFPGGLIPTAQLGTVFAFRIGGAQPSSAVRGWSPTGSAPAVLFRQPGALLPSGKVFIPSTAISPSFSYDPSTGAFTNVASPVYAHGYYMTTTLLDNGLVLVAGGINAPTSAELYDPVANKFTALPSMVQGHAAEASATKLNDGRVLIVGGPTVAIISQSMLSSAELFDPVSKTFSAAGPMITPRRYHNATLLSDGRVLISAGLGAGNLAEIFDPATNKFTATGNLVVGRFGATAVRLPNGKVLIIGGYGSAGAAEVFDPVAGAFSATGTAHADHGDGGAILLSNGQALVFGGGDSDNATTIAETYSQDSGVFSLTGGMSLPRNFSSSALLLDGRVLEAGGSLGATQPNTATAEIYTPVTQGLVTSQTGLTFRSAQASTTTSSQTIAVLSPSDTIPWTTSVKTFSGGNWLSVTPKSGNSAPGAAPVPLTITVNPAGLTAQTYFGAVTLTPTDQKHPPVTVAVVFTVVAAGAPAPPSVSPTGGVFTSIFGSNAKPQTFTVSNVTSSAVGFTGVASASPFFDFTPKSGTIGAGQSTTITVTPTNSALNGGTYRGSIKLTFTDGSTQSIDLLLLILAPSQLGSVNAHAASASCTPKQLLPVITSLGTGSTAPLAFPLSLSVQVVDNCGNNVDNGTVVVSFTNGDPPLSLIDLGGGIWASTWVPGRAVASTMVRADADTLLPALTGTVQVTVQVASNPNVPVVVNGGIVSSGDYTGSPALGLLVSIFGTQLADGPLGNSSLPLPEQLGSTQVFMSGVQLPLLYVSDSQVNVLVPYNIALNTAHQLLVQRGNAISVPVDTAILDTQPAILTTTGNGIGQGDVYKGGLTLADATGPVTAGDVVVIYCVGLGAVAPTVQAGDPSPSSPLASVPATVTVTIGGQSTTSSFAGLTPGYAGLYQINAAVPAGVSPGGQVPITISVAGKSSGGNVYIAVK